MAAAAAIPVIKTEPVDPYDLESKIVELCESHPGGLLDADLVASLPGVDPVQRIAVINALLTRGRLDLLKNPAGLLYKLRVANDSTKVQGADKEERLIYTLVTEAGNKGIWVRDMRKGTNLAMTQLNKILRAMETKKLIKSVRTVGAVRRKVYMLFEVEPDASVTGGTFYSDQEVDHEFVSLLSGQLEKYLEMKLQQALDITDAKDPVYRKRANLVTGMELVDHIKQLKISNIELQSNDIDMILDTLVWDGKAQRVPGPKGTWMYRAVKPLIPPAGLMRVPCGSCSVFSDCFPGREISPATCQYFDDFSKS